MEKYKEIVKSIKETISQINSITNDLNFVKIEDDRYNSDSLETALMAIKYELMFTRDKVQRHTNSILNEKRKNEWKNMITR